MDNKKVYLTLMDNKKVYITLLSPKRVHRKRRKKSLKIKQ